MPAARATRLLLILTLCALPLAWPGTVVAVADPLAVVTRATYDLFPTEHRVAVTVEGTATSNMPDSAEGRYFYDTVPLAVQPEAANFAASGEGGAPLEVRVVEQTEEFIALEITLSRPIFYQESYAFRLTFDLADPGGDPYRWLVITSNFVSIPIWAYGTRENPGSSVTVNVPGEYRASVELGEMRMLPGDDRAVSLRAEDVPDPLEFFSHVTVERRVALILERDFTVQLDEGEAQIRLRAWEDDVAWADSVQETLTVGLPLLVEAIGLDYPISSALTVREGISGWLDDYAGIYDELNRTIEMRPEAEPFVTLHEAAHIWFNSNLLDERWIAEGFASYYGDTTASAAGFPVEAFDIDSPLLELRIPLNEWAEPGDADVLREGFGYAASQHAANEIAALAGAEGLRTVWRAIAADELAYQPVGARRPDTNASATSEPWQRLLDLLEERTDAAYVSIWEEWVVTPDEEELLEERAPAREAYAELETAAGDWQLPRSMRLLMDAWQFADALKVIGDGHDVLDAWARLEERAAEVGLEPGRDVELRFEDGSMIGALGEARARLEALDVLDSGAERLARPSHLLEQIGLLGREPEALLEGAFAAFTESDEERAIELARDAVAVRDAAGDEGRGRVAVAAGAALVADVLVVALLWHGRGARRRPVAAPSHDLA